MMRTVHARFVLLLLGPSFVYHVHPKRSSPKNYVFAATTGTLIQAFFCPSMRLAKAKPAAISSNAVHVKN